MFQYQSLSALSRKTNQTSSKITSLKQISNEQPSQSKNTLQLPNQLHNNPSNTFSIIQKILKNDKVCNIIISFLDFHDFSSLSLTNSQLRVAVKYFFFSYSYSSQISSFEQDFNTCKLFQEFKLFLELKIALISPQTKLSFKDQIVLLYDKQNIQALELIHQGLIIQGYKYLNTNFQMNDVIPLLMTQNLEIAFPDIFQLQSLHLQRFRDISISLSKNQYFKSLNSSMNRFLEVLQQYVIMRLCLSDSKQIKDAIQVIQQRTNSLIHFITSSDIPPNRGIYSSMEQKSHQIDDLLHKQLKTYARLQQFELQKLHIFQKFHILPLRKGTKTIFELSNKNVFSSILQFLEADTITNLRLSSKGIKIFVDSYLEGKLLSLERNQLETLGNLGFSDASKLTQKAEDDYHFEYIYQFLLVPQTVKSYKENNIRLLIRFLTYLQTRHEFVLKEEGQSPWRWIFNLDISDNIHILPFFLRPNNQAEENIIEISQSQLYLKKLKELKDLFKSCYKRVPWTVDISILTYIFQTSRQIHLLRSVLSYTNKPIEIFRLNQIQSHLFLISLCNQKK